MIDQFLRSLDELGLQRPWYWDTFLTSLDHYHHMVYASAYTYRASVWFNFVVPGPARARWLREKYPASWADFDPIWERITERWREADPGNDFAVHGTAIVGVLRSVPARAVERHAAHTTPPTVWITTGERYIFCSRPCRWIFEQRAGALRRAQGRRQARARGRGAGQPARAACSATSGSTTRPGARTPSAATTLAGPRRPP